MDNVRRGFLFLFSSEHGARKYLIARWVFLRALGGIYFSAFLALVFQARGLIGTAGILPAAEFLEDARRVGAMRFWYVPSLLWISSSNSMLLTLMWVGLIAAVLLVANVWPRAMLVTCFLCFLSFVTAAQDFSGYQSDGMLLEAGFLSLFLAPPGVWPGLGARRPPVRAAMLLLLWEWFRIYFESGMVKLLSGDPTWRDLTAMYEYYPEWPAADLDRVVPATSAALVSQGDGRCDAGDGTGAGVDGVPAAAVADCLLPDRDGVADRGDRDGKLRVPQLPGAGAGGVSAG